MPKQTFFNLPEDKRKKIMELAALEFALNNYVTASLSRIVEKAGIAKGSMYQYFESKKDLYFFLIDCISAQKLAFITDKLEKKHSEEDFFSLYKSIIFQAAQFDIQNPALSRVLYMAGHESYHPEIGDVSKKILNESIQFMTSIVHAYKNKGAIRNDLSDDLIAFIISYLSVDIGDYIEKKFDFSYAEVLNEGKGVLPIPLEELDKVLTDLCEVLKYGLLPIPK
ncbi:MAG: TetR/AcrR family transcriptional regulator [Clostridia bacterium]|nr:TetR/AcrR family transcriptional regulator [Clostridia bacterium]